MNHKELRRALDERLALPKFTAGQALGWGRRSTEAAIRSGLMPVIPGPPGKETVPTWWVREQLRLDRPA
jgi:hypothetical protein